MALALCAAGRQHRFWELSDRLWQLQRQRGHDGNASNEAEYLLPRDEAVLPARLRLIVEELGLDLGRYDVDAGLVPAAPTRPGADADCASEVAADEELARALAIEAAPTYVVNGRIVSGQNPRVLLARIVEERGRAERCIRAIRAALNEPVDAAWYRDFLEKEGQRAVRP